MNYTTRLKRSLNCLHVLLVSCLFFDPVITGSIQLTSDNFDKLVGESETGLILFGADWCPYSVMLAPDFDTAASDTRINSDAVSCVIYDGDRWPNQSLAMFAQHEVVFLNFYADWCRFSQILAPVFDEAAEKISAEFPVEGRYLFGKVDCDDQTALAARFHISKYPTLKLITNGQVAKKEYRGQRSVDSLVEFIREQLKDPVKELVLFADVEKIEEKTRAVIGFFESKELPQYNAFRKAAKSLRDYCEFYAGIGEAVQVQRVNGDVVTFRPSRTKYGDANINFNGTFDDVTEIVEWATELCIPLVREITFENAEELTEEGLPFLILFHHPDDSDIIKKYSQVVKEQLGTDKGNINCLTADGIRFSHPLHHLGKTQKDLPLIAIDSFRHMYLFPDITQMTEPGKLKQFVDELYSGKLHREFHYGPDPANNEVAHHPDGSSQDPSGQSTTPPESTFKKLAPSSSRYTLLRDEL